ncbi:MAG: Type 1 glutamine amidotransferase-like domain-containing protein [Eubacterium sp.]
MGKIVAIGGGENGHHNTKYETATFDKEIIRLTGKTKPNFLFIGLANNYPDYYFEIMDGIYNGMYGCPTDYLRYKEIKDKNITSSKIKKADIIYVGGGNTYKLMRLFKLYGIDKMLVEAYNEDKVLCGVSAGGICWCDYGNSDSRAISSNSSQIIRVAGLGLINVLFAPHIVKEPDRIKSVRQMMKRTYKIPAVQLDNAALEVVDNQYRILTIDDNSVAEKCYWKNGKYITQNIISNEFRSIEELYERC